MQSLNFLNVLLESKCDLLNMCKNIAQMHMCAFPPRLALLHHSLIISIRAKSFKKHFVQEGYENVCQDMSVPWYLTVPAFEEEAQGQPLDNFTTGKENFHKR